MNLIERIEAARGQTPADLLLTNLQLVNVFSGEIYPTEIAIKDDIIIGIGPGYTARETLDLGGRYVAPGFIDAHVHIESSMCTPPEFSRAALTHGVTTVVTDPHEIANVHGLEGIHFMIESSQNIPLTVYVNAPSCVPATHMETAGFNLEATDLQTLLDQPRVLGLAEVMNYPGVIFGDEGVLDKLTAFEGRVQDGHSPGLRGQSLNAYIAAGIFSDHECTDVEEAREKLQKGMVIFIREATNAQNLRPLLPLITPENSRRICFCTDDRHPADLLDIGSIDHMVRMAIAEGNLDPVAVIRMATLNTAEYFRLYDRGAIAPGRRADICVFSDLRAPHIETVFCGGKMVAHNGKLTVELPSQSKSRLPSSMNIKWDGLDLSIPAASSHIHVIGTVPNQVVTENRIAEAKIENGLAVADPARDLLKIVVIERHHASGNIGKGFIQGIGLQRGAIAGTVAHDHHNLVAIGADDASMLTAIRAVERMGGGFVVVEGETVLAELPLPVAGLMSQAPIDEVRVALDKLLDVARRKLGSPLHDPFMVMGFMALEVIPSLKLTDVGLVDVDQFTVVNLFV